MKIRSLLIWSTCAVLPFGAPWVSHAQGTGSDSVDEQLELQVSGMAGADGWMTPPDDLDPDARIVDVGQPLSVAEAVALSIRNNLDVEVERYAPLITEANRAGAWGAYDPTLSADALYDSAKSPNTFTINPVANSVTRERSVGVGIDQLLPYLGASLGVRFETSDVTTNSGIQAFSPQYDSSVFLTGKIPLARNLIWNETWTNVKVSDVIHRGALETFRAVIMDNIRTTVDGYWNLVAARDQVRVAQKSLETARALLEQVKTQYEVGVVSRVEVVEAEAGVADREFNLITTANEYRNAQDALVDIVLGEELSALSDVQFAPSENPDEYDVRPVDLEASVRQAFEKRPELRVADRTIEQGELDLRFAKNQRLPQLDAELRYGFVGVAGRPNKNLSFGTPPTQSAYGDSVDDFFTSDGADNFRVAAKFSIPIPNTTARKRVTRSKLELRRSKTRRIRLEQTIILEVREAARTIAASAQGIAAAERRRLAAEEQLRAERIRLEHGESTPFEVLQRENDLVEAESQKIRALQAYRSAEVGLERASGTILESHNVAIDGVREPATEGYR